MASNHSIIKIEETEELVGDPMEIKLFEFGNFKLNQSNSDPEIIFSFESNRNHRGDVYRRYEFDSDVQRMSVLVGENKSSYYAYSKGSPEMMLTIMNPRTVPQNYHAMLTSYASSGFRVLAIASRSVGGDILKLSRADVERDLTFNGFEVFENKLKPETKGAIKQLKDAAIGCVMITGDNSLTGANISYQCNISSRNKKMIICDYDKGTFVKENFNYVNRGGQADEPEILSETINQLQKSFESNNKISNSSVTPANISHIEIQLVEKNNAIVGQKSELELNRPKGEEFMEEMISIAEATNSQLCVTGKAFNEMFAGSVFEITELQRRFLSHVSVYARTKPNDKAKVVMVYQHTGLSVSMCGDGANDCGALKQADIGLSLSQAEASISAPFTSKIPNISSMVELIKECRAGLATNFSLFNIMAIYALIQYSSTIVTEKFLAYPSNYAYTYWDLCLNFVLILFIGNTATAD